MVFSLFKREKGPEFITGRVATRKETKFGFFSLVTDTGEEISKPYKIKIPQAVIHSNQESKVKSKGILIQAEKVTKSEMKGKVVCTVKLENNQVLNCLLEELKLLEK